MRLTLAVVVKNGEVLSYATNEHKEPCKREGMATGTGYELCEWCNYGNHAEANALKGVDATGATLYLFGHYYACDSCKERMKKKRISNYQIMNIVPSV